MRFFFSFLFVAAVAVAVAAVVVAAVVVVVDDDKAVSSSEPLRLDGDDFFRTDFRLEVISFGSEQIIKSLRPVSRTAQCVLSWWLYSVVPI